MGSKRFKKRIATLVAVLLLVSLIPANALALSVDDYTSHWAGDTIKTWIDEGYISGYSDGSFKPDGEISRAEFITLINKAYGYEQVGQISFSDVKQTDWFYSQIQIAVAKGYIAGYPDGSMKPNSPITREEAATIIVKLNSLVPDEASANAFKDDASLTWSKGFVGAVYKAGIMKGHPDGHFHPQMMIKRAEAVIALNGAKNYKVENLVPVPEQNTGGGGGSSPAILPPNPIDVLSVLEGNGIEYLLDGDMIYIGSNDELIMTAASTTATFDGIACTLPYSPEMSGDNMVINPDFFKKFFGATYSRTGAIILPSYVKDLLGNDFTAKSDIYQSNVVGEEDFINAIDWETGWNVALELGQIGSSTDWGFHTAGTEEGLEAALLVREKFEDILGYDAVGSDQFNVYAWRYLSSSLTISSGGITASIPNVSAVGTKATELGGITAEVVDIGKATKQDFAALATAGIDLNGKIAFIAVDLDYVPWQSQACFSAVQNGAIGVIYYHPNYYAQYVDGANGQTALQVQDWSGQEIDIPVVNISKKDGLALKAQLALGEVEATLVSNVEIVEDSDKGLNVYAIIEGSKYPDEFVMVNAHSDAYFTGFQDDSIAVGAMVSFAEAFVESGIRPERSVILLKTDAEEFGVMDLGTDWLVGSWLMMKDNSEAQTWKGKIVASLTLELMAYAGADKFEMRASDTLHEYISTAAQGFDYRGHVDENKIISGFDGLGVVKNEVSNMSDEFTMVRYGVPTFRTNTHAKVVSDIYHTQFDSPETTSEGKYADCLKYYGTYLIRLANTPVAPYDLTKTADKYLTQVDFNYLTSLGYSSTLSNQANAYKENAREVYLKNSLILKLMDYASQHSLDVSAVDFEKYNKHVRDAVGTIISQSTHLAGESVTLEVPFYINMTKTLTNGLASLREGKGPASEAILKALPARYYTNYLEYDCWYMTNTDNINLGARDVLWANDIKVQYLDIYHFYQGLKLKADGDNFDEEIATAEAWLEDEANPHLAQAVNDDILMFIEANQSLNAANGEAEDLIQMLMNLCGLD